jgi:nucleoside-diphosphate-sugar epimerase
VARILITGATGFIGARLVARLVGSHELWALGRRSRADEFPQVRWRLQDFAEGTWNLGLPSEIDAIIHLAQSPHFRNFPEGASDVFGVAVNATMRLLDFAIRAKTRHFIVASTGGLYGASDTPVRESDPLPESRSQLGFYFASKRASELLVAQYAGEFSTVILRCFFVYGAGQSSQMLLPRLVANVRAGSPVYLHGEDGMRLNPIHVDDAVLAIGRALELNDSRIFNIAGPEVTTIREIAEAIGRHVGRRPIFTVDKTIEPNHLVADTHRMSTALGAPRIGIEDGVAELCGSGVK